MMGWANCGIDSQGRPIGYAFEATCDDEGCTTEIDRGLAYACGAMHGEDVWSCDGYFCYEHLLITELPDGSYAQLCPLCSDHVNQSWPDEEDMPF